MSGGRVSRMCNGLANAVQASNKELVQGANPNFRHWFVGRLREFPVSWEAELKEIPRLKKWDNWTVKDLRGAATLSANFGVFFLLGEMYGRGNVSGYDLGEKPGHH